MKRIVLCMIVKNESSIIARCIDRLLPLIDAISICDTGSTDNTVGIITKYNDTLPTNCIIDPWVNFGHNRSRSFKEAVRFCTSLEWNLKETWTLFVDADMLLVVKPEFNKDDLSSSGYRIEQKSGPLSYQNLRMGRMDCDWESVGVTHEYWSARDPHNKGITFTDLVYINDVGDGGSKSDKTSRDIQLLEKGMEDEPNNRPRYSFYLGQSYKDQGEFDKAIDMLKKRIKFGGWDEEIWYSHYTIAICFMLKSDLEKEKKDYNFAMAVTWFWIAFNNRPSRREPLTKLAFMYRSKGLNYESFKTAKLALQVPDTKDVLFVDRMSYDFEAEREISISAYYTGDHEDGRRMSEILLRSKKVPAHERNMAMTNIVFYLWKLPLTNDFVIPSSLGDCFFASSPSISENYINVRHVNYKIDEATGGYMYPDGSKSILTRNILWKRNGNKMSSSRELVEDISVYGEKNIRGLEDIRLFMWKGELWGIATTCRFSKSPNMAIFPIDTSGEGDIKLDRVYHVNFAPSECEKNWMPFESDTDELTIIYSHDPMTLIDIQKPADDYQGVLVPKRILQLEIGSKILDFRGSGPPVKYKDVYLAIIHEVSFQNGRRAYIHRFVWYDLKKRPIRFSQPLNLFHIGIEYIAGFYWDNTYNKFVIGYSVWDRESHLSDLSEEDFFKLEWYDIETNAVMKCTAV